MKLWSNKVVRITFSSWLIFTIVLIMVFAFNLSKSSEFAYVIFTGEAPKKYEKNKQPLTMYACNNTVVSHQMEWTKKIQKAIPYGIQSKEGKEYFISKYYIASPPLPNSFSPGKDLTLGVLSEDHFKLTETGQNIDVFFDYKLLKPIQLANFPINYVNREREVARDASSEFFSKEISEVKSCIEQGINTIPINIRCSTFEYASGDKEGLGKGIAQIARVKNKKGKLTEEGQLFIPLNAVTLKPLKHCTVEILNDIMLEHKIYFGTAKNHQEKIDLTGAYEEFINSGKHVELYCKSRPKSEPAEGCNPILPE